ncbi:hypothetical protein BH09BAC1_BH09BAC1_17610 [soil metagenome]
MKATIINRFSVLLFAFFALVTVASCNKDDDHDHDGEGHVHALFTNKYGLTDNLQIDSVYTGANGRKFTVSLNQFYISNVRLVTHSGTEIAFDSIYFLVKTGEENEIEMEDVPAGHYTGIRFDVGIDSATNHMDPSTYAAGHPLAPQVPSMHWSWNSGYVFAKLEGLVDTSDLKNGPANMPYEIHLGGDMYRVAVELAVEREISEDNHPGINISLNTAALLTGIDLGGADLSTHTMDNMSLANRFKANLAAAFTAE